ncbi:uncharacterized protein LOC142774205 [Rhipicephalus microplus]|uniref:uncharacterized protein LOC142774205 n=1 Tax=Rhipicephalus microplus TaxID=6941 RepID=UPI003F6B0C26
METTAGHSSTAIYDPDNEGTANNKSDTYIDAYIIYGLISALLASALIILFIATVAHVLTRRKERAEEPTMRTSSNTNSTRAHSWVMLCHENQEAPDSASHSDGVEDCQAGPSQPDVADVPRVVACSRRLESRRPSLKGFLAARASERDEVGSAQKGAEKETAV